MNIKYKKYKGVSIDSISTVGEGTTIYHNAVIINSKIGKNVVIGQFSLIRDCIIEDNVIIGPHSEVARSHFMNNSNAFHKATIIDSLIKSNVTIGPNFVTANTNIITQEKHKTIIEKNARIGANVTLIAPITIGENSIIGANSLINKNLEKNIIIFNKKEVIKREIKYEEN